VLLCLGKGDCEGSGAVRPEPNQHAALQSLTPELLLIHVPEARAVER